MAFELLDRGGYVEFRLFGVIDGAVTPDGELLGRFADVGRVLVDASDVQAVSADVMWMAAVVQRAYGFGGFRAAVLAGDDIIYGTLRQVSAYRGATPEGSTVEFFRDRSEALAWLLTPG